MFIITRECSLHKPYDLHGDWNQTQLAQTWKGAFELDTWARKNGDGLELQPLYRI